MAAKERCDKVRTGGSPNPGGTGSTPSLGSPWLSAGLETIRRSGWVPLAVFLTHEFGAHVVNAYGRWPLFDIPMHLLGGFAIAFFFSGALHVFASHGLVAPIDARIRMVLVFSLACAAAVFWEFAEWIADHTLGTHCQLGLEDTLGDIFMGLAGAATCLLLRGRCAEPPS
jgi:hypothetical protein